MRILVIDDDPCVCEVVARYLQADRHSVVLAANGKEGLKKFCKGGFDLVITDRAMPTVSGDQVAAEIKRLSPATPVILLTGFGEIMEFADCLPPVVDLIVSKPLTLDEFRNTIGRLMRRVAKRNAKRNRKKA